MSTDKRDTAVLIMGTFNPITRAHIALGEGAKEKFPEADIIYVPSNLSFMKGWKNVDDSFLKDNDRLALIRESIKGYSDFSVADIEITGVSDGRTYNTVQLIKESYNKIVIVMGIDKLGELDRWYNADKLFSENTILVFERNGENLESMMTDFIRAHRENFKAAAMPDCYEYISSTAVREAFDSGNLSVIEKDVPEAVYTFLLNRGNCN